MQKELLHKRFIKLLGVRIKPPSSLFLSELIEAHMARIPFENLSKLYYKAQFNQEQIPSYDQYLEGISAYHFGGTCYANNYYFYALLEYLGFRVKLCAADIRRPGTHMVIQLSLEQRDYLLDFGYAAPFIQAIPLDSDTDYSISFGRDRFVFKPRDKKGLTQVQLFRDSQLLHGYTVHPQARKLADFKQVISESFLPDSLFFKTLLVAKYVSGCFIILHNLEFIESVKSESRIVRISDKRELPELIEKKFQIPETITGSLIRDLELKGNAWT